MSIAGNYFFISIILSVPSSVITEAVVDLLPSPLDIPEERAEKLLCSASRRFDSLHPETQKLKQGTQFYDIDDICSLLFLQKFFSLPKYIRNTYTNIRQ